MKDYILLLDAILGNGNILILRDDNVLLDFIQVAEGELKSDKVLSVISVLLSKSKLNKGNIKSILLTTSEKSMTRSRIFKSIGLGLKNALNIPMTIISEQEMLSVLEYNNLIIH